MEGDNFGRTQPKTINVVLRTNVVRRRRGRRGTGYDPGETVISFFFSVSSLLFSSPTLLVRVYKLKNHRRDLSPSCLLGVSTTALIQGPNGPLQIGKGRGCLLVLNRPSPLGVVCVGLFTATRPQTQKGLSYKSYSGFRLPSPAGYNHWLHLMYLVKYL